MFLNLTVIFLQVPDLILNHILPVLFYCINGFIFSLFFIIVVFYLTTSITFTFGCIRSSMKLHNMTFSRFLHCPMCLFDVTPVGRILNRFTNDLDAVDNLLPSLLRSCLLNVFTVTKISS